jgi:DNA-binding NarL/FixJ family response regulator
MLNECISVCRDPKETSTSLNRHELPHMAEIRILILHSDPFIAAGLEAVLSKRSDLKVVTPRPGSVTSRLDGQSAEADVVIADYDSGLRFSDTGRGSRERVVILTHSDSEAQICRALENGARGYLLFGCSPDEMVKCIRSVYEGGVALEPLVASRVADNMNKPALTAREEGILRQVMFGLSNKRIAKKFNLAEGTIKTHLKSIFTKLHARSRTEATAIAHRRGLLASESEGVTQRPGVSEQRSHLQAKVSSASLRIAKI